jgi:hypothetical protein
MFPLWRISLPFLLLLPVAASAQNFGQDVLEGFDDELPMVKDSDVVLSGFDDDSLRNSSPPKRNEGEGDFGILAISGWAKLGSSWNFVHQTPRDGETDWRGLSRLRSELLLKTTVELPDSWHMLASGKCSYDLSLFQNEQSARHVHNDLIFDNSADQT